MNERKNNAGKKEKKDYYFSVVLSQLICCLAASFLFFYIRGTSAGQELKAYYAALLEDDFFSVELDTVVSRIREYIIEGEGDLAVFGSRVEPYNKSPDTETDETSAVNPTEKQDSAAETTSQPAAIETIATVKARVKTVPLKLSFKKEQKIIFPLYEGRYTSFFGERTDPITEGSDYHKGIDIGADEGDRIRAAYDGRVVSVGEDARSGKYVFLEHEKDVVTFYCHCSEILVKKGDKVSQGDTIALVGSTGYSTGPHLHFEVRIKDVSVDPLPLLRDAADNS